MFIVLAFFLFTRKNHERIVQQNANYVQDSTIQVAERISDVLAAAKDNIRTIAYLYGETLREPEAEPKELKAMQDNSLFDISSLWIRMD